MAEKNHWMIRAGRNSAFLEDFLDRGIVALGIPEVADLSECSTYSEVQERVRDAFPDWSPSKRGAVAGGLFKIGPQMEVEDVVMSYDTSARIYHLGLVDGPYQYRPGEGDDFVHQRKVVWQSTIDRDDLSESARYSLGSLLAAFQIPTSVVEEIRKLQSGAGTGDGGIITPDEESTVEPVSVEEQVGSALERAHEFRKDAISRLTPMEMEEFVATVLRGMGYKTQLSAPGPDRGCDITASKDGLGLAGARIRVEVKHRRDAISAPQIRSFTGGLRPGDRGLFVSTGGFTKEARYEAERAIEPVTLVDLDRLAELYVDAYEDLDLEDRVMVPLRRVWWPEARG